MFLWEADGSFSTWSPIPRTWDNSKKAFAPPWPAASPFRWKRACVDTMANTEKCKVAGHAKDVVYSDVIQPREHMFDNCHWNFLRTVPGARLQNGRRLLT